MSDAAPVSYEVDGRVARITLDRPERGNGITRGWSRELGGVPSSAPTSTRRCT